MNNDSHQQDGLEGFFRDRLSGYQDEPSSDMWDRIEGGIPEKPVRNYKTIARWSGAAVAACLILSLGFFTFQYKQQLDGMAAELNHTKNNMASLEQRLNNAQQNNSEPIAAAEVVVEDDRNLNTNPSIKEITKYYPQIVYLPSENTSQQQNFTAVAKNNTNEQPVNVVTTVAESSEKGSSSSNNWQFAKNASVMSSGQYAYYDANHKDVLDLKKKILPKRSSIRMSRRSVNPSYNKSRYAIAGNKPQFAKQNDESNPIASIINLRSKEQQMKELNFSKLSSVGAEYNVSSSLSLFMMPDYLESLHTPNTLGSGELYPYPVGLETGFTYTF